MKYMNLFDTSFAQVMATPSAPPVSAVNRPGKVIVRVTG
jgi:hypothetical protein